MPSRLDSVVAHDFARGMSEVKQTITRRIGGKDDRTEPVEANVDLDEKVAAAYVANAGGLVDSNKGQFTEVAGVIDVASDQDNFLSDTWVIDGKVYTQLGDAIGSDGCKTIVILRRVGMRAREPRVTGR